jgi:anti-sigma factor RsiW
MEREMEHEESYRLMMAALDEALDGRQTDQLQQHLQSCPACAREWQALTAIHQLFLQAPALSPAAGFTQRTLSRLPQSRYRIWLMGAVYFAVLFSGLIPALGFGWIAVVFGPALLEPAVWRGLAQALGQAGQLLATILGALWLGVEGLAVYFSQEPILWGWLLTLTAVVILWGGVYRQLLAARTPVRANFGRMER